MVERSTCAVKAESWDGERAAGGFQEGLCELDGLVGATFRETVDEEAGVEVRREDSQDSRDKGEMLFGGGAVEEVFEGSCDDHDWRGWEKLGVG